MDAGRAGFVGRRAEREAIATRSAVVREGRAQMVWIEGDAGAGKTALVHQVVRELADMDYLEAASDELAREVPLWVTDQLAPSRARTPFGAGLELLSRFGDPGREAPLAVVVEDLHWADAASRQALLVAARHLDRDRVLLIITSRPEVEQSDGWERLRLDAERCLSLTLGELTVDEVSELAEQARLALGRRQVERLHRHTRGHPLYVQTLLTELAPEQLAAVDGELPAPRSLRSTTVATLAGLPAPARRLGTALAVLNRRAPLGLAARVAGVESPTRALDELAGSGLVRWSSAGVGTPIEFAHPLYRTAIYEDLSPSRRQALHAAAATALDPPESLVHRVAAAEGENDALADELEAWAGRETAADHTELAARNLLWAASLSSRREARERRLVEAARQLLAAGLTTRAAGLRERLEACADRGRRGLALGRLEWDLGDAAAAERWLASTLAAEAPGDVRREALLRLALLFVTQGRAGEAIGAAEQALHDPQADPTTLRDARLLRALGTGMAKGAPAGLATLEGDFAKLPEVAGGADVDLLVTRGTLNLYAQRTAAAIADLRAALRLARSGDLPPEQLLRAHVHLAQLSFWAGSWDDAELQARVALSLLPDERRAWLEAQAHAALAPVLASRGRLAEADRHVAAAEAAARGAATPEAFFTARIAQAAAARARGDPRAVISALSPLLGEGREDRLPMMTSLSWWSTLIEALLEAGDPEAAGRQLAGLERAAAERGLDLAGRIAGLRAQLEASRGRAAAATAAFEEAISLLGPDDPVLDRALVRLAWGRLQLAQGQRRAAVSELRDARQLLAPLGAKPFLARVERELQACGLRPARGRRTSLFELTDRERDVAALVGQGLTNREVAAQLYMSEKAVEYHLRHVFEKLGISSRRQLRAPAGAGAGGATSHARA